MVIFLVYHKVQAEKKGEFYTVRSVRFLTQLSMVQETGLPVLNPRVTSGLTGHVRRGVVFTFDDGSTDHFQTVRPLLRDFGFPALFYVCTAKLNRTGYLTSEQVRMLWEEGHTIGSHSHSHRRLDVLPDEQIKEELELSAIAIEKIIGQRPVHFAPPGGFYNTTVQELAYRLGYVSFRTMDWGYNKLFNPMQIQVVPITDRLGFYFVKCAFHGRLEKTLKSIDKLKNRLRTILSESSYRKLRGRITCSSART